MTASRIRADLANLEAYAAWLAAGQRGTTRDRMIEQGGILYWAVIRESKRQLDVIGWVAPDMAAMDDITAIQRRAGVAWRTIQEQAGQLSLFA
jgi:hypothetical protein